ncbi:MAG: hypothetical protein IKI77_12800, partial [Oscillospiraceae bacterium]|nr:hypothetical protein [Oscillospiraceae bacterium]
DLIAHYHDRVEGCHGILEYHGNPAAANPALLPSGLRELLKKFDQNFNTGARRMRNNKSLNSHSPAAPADLQKSAYCVILVLYSKRIEVQL